MSLKICFPLLINKINLHFLMLIMYLQTPLSVMTNLIFCNFLINLQINNPKINHNNNKLNNKFSSKINFNNNNHNFKIHFQFKTINNKLQICLINLCKIKIILILISNHNNILHITIIKFLILILI